jgi:hypothetical protein
MILSADDVAILQVPLSEPVSVARAVNLPHQIALRYRKSMVDVAVRAGSQRLAEAGLSAFKVPEWASETEVRGRG